MAACMFKAATRESVAQAHMCVHPHSLVPGQVYMARMLARSGNLLEDPRGAFVLDQKCGDGHTNTCSIDALVLLAFSLLQGKPSAGSATGADAARG